MSDQIYRLALGRIIEICENPPNGNSDGVLLGRIMEIAQATLADTEPLPFEAGDRVRHVGRDQLGTVIVAESMYMQVKFDDLSPNGKPSIGIYDRAWFRTYPKGLIPVADTGSVT